MLRVSRWRFACSAKDQSEPPGMVEMSVSNATSGRQKKNQIRACPDPRIDGDVVMEGPNNADRSQEPEFADAFPIRDMLYYFHLL